MHSTFLRNNGLDWIGLVGSQEEINKVCKFLNEVTGEMKKKTNNFHDTSFYISSNTPCEIMRTHHGADRRNQVK